MGAILLDGKALAQRIKAEIREEVKRLGEKKQKAPTLAMVLVGKDPASLVYVNAKAKACAEVGMSSITEYLSAQATQQKVCSLLQRLSAEPEIDGILLQLPLPLGLDRFECIKHIAPAKDIDGLGAVSQGLLAWQKPGLYPCTPLGVMALLRESKVTLEGSLACVLGRSLLVGSPLTHLLAQAGATTISMHSKSLNLPELVKQANIVIVATGQKGMVKGSWIKPGAVVIDVGIHRDAQNRLCGDVEFETAQKVAGFITPVPGGVGPMTIAMLLKNTLLARNATKSGFY